MLRAAKTDWHNKWTIEQSEWVEERYNTLSKMTVKRKQELTGTTNSPINAANIPFVPTAPAASLALFDPLPPPASLAPRQTSRQPQQPSSLAANPLLLEQLQEFQPTGLNSRPQSRHDSLPPRRLSFSQIIETFWFRTWAYQGERRTADCGEGTKRGKDGRKKQHNPFMKFWRIKRDTRYTEGVTARKKEELVFRKLKSFKHNRFLTPLSLIFPFQIQI